ncbi:MAG: glycosyltransferase family 4 protein [Actinomycetota bacterium]
MGVDVLHVLATNERRGAETFGYELHHALSARGFRSAVRCIEPGPGDRSLPVPALAGRRFSLAGTRALRTEAAQARVVVSHGSSTLLACSLGLAGLGVPFVYLSIGDPRYWAGSAARRARVRWLIRRAGAVVAISPGAQDALISHYGLAPERVTVIPNGRSSERFGPAGADDRAAAKRSFGIDPGRDVVAIVGALSPEKRVDVAIEAVGRLAGVVLVVAGDGPERPALTRLADRVAPNRVVFAGRTDGSEAVLTAADVLALSSDSEGVPGVLIEAGLSGLPVVTTDVGWVRDVVVDGETGLVVARGRSEPFANALRDALDRRASLGAAARKHCLAEFEMGRVTDLWQELIEEVGNRPT